MAYNIIVFDHQTVLVQTWSRGPEHVAGKDMVPPYEGHYDSGNASPPPYDGSTQESSMGKPGKIRCVSIWNCRMS